MNQVYILIIAIFIFMVVASIVFGLFQRYILGG